MKFLVDENLPPVLALWIRDQGYEALHVNDFGADLPVSDQAIRQLALHKNWIVITGDDDFVESYVSRKVPEKLVYVFNIKGKDKVMEAFSANWEVILGNLRSGELIEVNPEGVKLHF